MADTKIKIDRDSAVLLLAAAEELGLSADVVRTTSLGHFLVPEEVAEKAGFSGDDASEDSEAPKPAATKKAAVKAAAKKE